MEQPYIQLTIRRRGESNLVTIDVGGPTRFESEIRIEEPLLRGLVAQVARLTTPKEQQNRSGEPTQSDISTPVRRLREIGKQIFFLLPEQARVQLRDAAPTDLFLHTDERLIHVPWELCHDGVDFFAAKFQMGRYVNIPRPIPFHNRQPVEPGLLKMLLIADPTESLPQAAREAEQLCQVLDGVEKVKVTLLGGQLVSKAELLTELQSHDVVHFAGHSHYDPIRPNQSGWHLHEGLLTAEELRTLSRPPLLVFSNSCQAGATMAWGGRYRYDEEAFGIGSAFLAAGVRNYIGTFWVVHDEESRDFAVVFYKGLASGLNLGEALRRARVEIRNQKGGERLTWASYMLYGDPSVTFFPTQEAKPVFSPTKAVERKLVAILHADVKGYSRRMEEDEEATARTVSAYLKVMNDLVQEHQGEVIGTPAGDDLLTLFSSAVEAVRCAVEIQRELQQRNAQLPVNRRIEFRIGINLGEVSRGENTVHGDGINFAALLQHEVATPGGICISEVVHDQIKNRPELAEKCEDLGIKSFEKMKRSVRVYRVHLEPRISPPPPRPKRPWRVSSSPQVRLLGEVLLLILLAAALIFIGRGGCSKPTSQAVVVRPPKALKPLHPEHIWISAVIGVYSSSQLSHAKNLRVYPQEHFDFLLAQNKSSDTDVARQLGITKMIRINFLLEDNLMLRIEAHLEDVKDPKIEFSEEMRGKLEDLFNLVQELTGKIVKRLNLQLGEQPEIPSSASDAFKLMLEGEGEIPVTPPQQHKTSPPVDSHPQEKEPHSDAASWLRWLEASTAWADETSPQRRSPEDEVRQALETYRQAYEKRDLLMLENVYETFTAAQRQANTEYFQNTQDLRVTIHDVDISVSGDKAAVSYTREDEFRDAKTGQKVKLDARFTKIFVRTDTGWRMSMGKK
jgi:class 3 adenylate cyclase/ketosteroid isomerase-like protein